MACDICGNNDGPLVNLNDGYQTREIKQICDGCQTVVNRKNLALMTLMQRIREDLLARFMKARKATARVEAK